MVQSPRISTALQKKHQGQAAISLPNGKIVAFGKNSVIALKKAKKKIPDIESRDFVVSKTHHKYLAV